MQKASKILKNLAAIAGAIVCIAQPSWAAATRHADYLNEPALVLSLERIKSDELPHSVFLPGIPLTYANDIKFACKSSNTRQNDLLVYMPRSKTCMTIDSVFDIARTTHPQKAHFSILQRDLSALTNQLKTESFVVLKPALAFVKPNIMMAGTAAEMCTCPIDPEPTTEEIFINGFENIF